MIHGLESVLIGSESAESLAKFYQETVGLKAEEEMVSEDGGEAYYPFSLGNASLVIMDHSQVKGKNQAPGRIMINLEVDDLEKEFAAVKERGAKVVAEIYHIEGYGLVSTFEDPDGNYFQLVQVKGS